jgi:Mn2+/Fe2+ NRAMP family transporter
MFVAIIGTSISPYLFFWQASEEAEEDVAKEKIKEIGKGNPKVSKKEIKLMRIDIAVGIAFAELIVWAIMITTAGSPFSRGDRHTVCRTSRKSIVTTCEDISTCR